MASGVKIARLVWRLLYGTWELIAMTVGTDFENLTPAILGKIN